MHSALSHRLNKLQSYSLPSGSYIDLTLGASGSSYTAPADGCIFFHAVAANNDGYSGISVERPGGYGIMSWIPRSNNSSNIIFPVTKNSIFKIDCINAINPQARFYYTQGSAPQS